MRAAAARGSEFVHAGELLERARRCGRGVVRRRGFASLERQDVAARVAFGRRRSGERQPLLRIGEPQPLVETEPPPIDAGDETPEAPVFLEVGEQSRGGERVDVSGDVARQEPVTQEQKRRLRDV